MNENAAHYACKTDRVFFGCLMYAVGNVGNVREECERGVGEVGEVRLWWRMMVCWYADMPISIWDW